MEEFELISKIIQSALTSIAIVISGIWAYFKFLRGRMYKPRIEVSVECKRHFSQDKMHLHIITTLVNKGLSKVDIDIDSSAMRLSELANNNSTKEFLQATPVKWSLIGTYTIFEQHGWIEPDEKIQDHMMIECKATNPIIKIECFLLAKKQQWYSSCVSA